MPTVLPRVGSDGQGPRPAQGRDGVVTDEDPGLSTRGRNIGPGSFHAFIRDDLKRAYNRLVDAELERLIGPQTARPKGIRVDQWSTHVNTPGRHEHGDA